MAQVHLVQKEILALQDHRVILVPQDHKVMQAQWDLAVLTAQTVKMAKAARIPRTSWTSRTTRC